MKAHGIKTTQTLVVLTLPCIFALGLGLPSLSLACGGTSFVDNKSGLEVTFHPATIRIDRPRTRNGRPILGLWDPNAEPFGEKSGQSISARPLTANSSNRQEVPALFQWQHNTLLMGDVPIGSLTPEGGTVFERRYRIVLSAKSGSKDAYRWDIRIFEGEKPFASGSGLFNYFCPQERRALKRTQIEDIEKKRILLYLAWRELFWVKI